MKYWITPLIAVVAAVFMAALALYLPLTSPVGIFNTPDEQANYFFAETFVKHGELRVFEPLEQFIDNTIHPRGVNVVRGFLVPESFLGLPLLTGVLLKFIPPSSRYALALFTLGVLPCLYGLFRSFFDRRTSVLAFFSVLGLPAFLYFSGRPYLHNLLFLDFLILGFWLMVRARRAWDTVAGILLGLALMFRTAELTWVVLAAFLLLFVKRKQFVLRIISVGFGALLILGPLLFFNQELYGNFFHVGYSVTESEIATAGATGVPQFSKISIAAQLLLPFGFHPLSALAHFIKFGLTPMWWYVAPMMLGAIVVRGKSVIGTTEVSKEIRNLKSDIRTDFRTTDSLISARSYTIVWFAISLYLVFVYGSFRAEVFADPMHPLAATIGAPYLRYWLPIFVFGAPLVAQFFLWLFANAKCKMQNAKFHIFNFSFYIGAVILLVFLSLRSVLWHGPESWLGIQEKLWEFSEARERAVRVTPDAAVFLVPRWADRIYFPVRRVVVDVEGKDVVGIIKMLQGKGVPIFWHRGRGEIKLEPQIYDAGFQLKRRFDIDPKGKIYEIGQ